MTDHSLNHKRVCILDTHGLLYQLFHALPPMSSPQGEPVGAVYGLVRDLFSLLDKHRPDYLFCAFDVSSQTFRKELYDQYKANRSAMPEELRPQIVSARELLEAMNIPSLGVPGFEADDILATVSKQVVQKGGECMIVTSDKDCRQLINEKVSLFNLRKQAFYRAEQLQEDWGIRPDQVVDFQSLVGDSTDNVPGVPLIGPKIAAELLNKYDTLEGVFEHATEISGKKRQENIINGKENAYLSRKLVQLRDDVPIDIDWEHSLYQGYDPDKVKDLFRRFGFQSLMGKIASYAAADSIDGPSDEPDRAVAPPKNKPKAERSLLPDEELKTPAQPIVDPDYRLVDTPEAFEEFFEKLSEQKLFSFDTETMPIRPQFEATLPRYAQLVGMSFAWNDQQAWYLPFRGPLGALTLPLQKYLERLKPILEDPQIGKIGQNLKYDLIVLKNLSVSLQGIRFDTMLAHYLLHAGELTHNLDDMAELYLGHQTIPISQLIGTGKKQKTINEVQTDQVADYAGEDALVVWRLYPLLQELIQEDEAMARLLDTLELPLMEVLANMEFTGIEIDEVHLKELHVRFEKKLNEIEKEIFELAGRSFNIASPKQLATILFDELGLPVSKRTRTGPSTDMEVLEELKTQHPLPEKIVQYRQLSKLLGTYVDALPQMVHPITNRIHSSFNQVATATGRLSSSNPNLQNIPVRTAEGREIRSAFRAGSDNSGIKYDYLLSCDYSQIELRVLAHFSQDDRLCESFRNNEDIHARVAGEIFDLPLDQVSDEMRRTAKAVNFGVIYGQTAFGLSKQLGIDQKEAKVFIDGYFNKYAKIRFYLDSILDECIEKGYVSTLLGRRRYFREGTIRNNRTGSLNQAERMAINTVIQGTAADLIKKAMVELKNTIPKELNANLLLQIHDELVFEVTEKDAQQLKDLVVQTMSLNQPLIVPLVIDAEWGQHWK